MAIYQPIRDAFNDFNKLLLDSQTWNERHQQIQHQKEMDHMKLQNGIEQQMFNNQMATKAHQLAVNGDLRSAQKLEFDVMDSNRKFELNEEATRLGMQNTEESIKSSKLDRMQKVQNLQRTEEEKAMRPILMQKAAEQIFNYDPILERENSMLDAQARLSDVKARIKDTSPDAGMNRVARAKLNRELNKTKGEINRIGASLQLPAQVGAIRKQADAAMNLSVQFANNGDDDTALRLQQKAVMLEERAVEMVEMVKDKTGGTSKGASAAAARADAAFQFGNDQLRKDYSPHKDLLPLWPDQKAGIAYVEKVYTLMANEPILDKDGNDTGEVNYPKTKHAASKLKVLAQQAWRIAHQNAYRDYLEVKDNPEDLEEWTAVVDEIFGYLPTKPFTNQIWRNSKLKDTNKNK